MAAKSIAAGCSAPLPHLWRLGLGQQAEPVYVIRKISQAYLGLGSDYAITDERGAIVSSELIWPHGKLRRTSKGILETLEYSIGNSEVE